eukprot:366024-Chlamydomonas_euryale.AAC.3
MQQMVGAWLMTLDEASKPGTSVKVVLAIGRMVDRGSTPWRFLAAACRRRMMPLAEHIAAAAGLSTARMGKQSGPCMCRFSGLENAGC